MATTVAGMKFSDQLAALLDHAVAHGFRLEPDPKNKPNGSILYPPDQSISAIRFSERGAKFNRAHYENLRRDVYRAGCPPLPADVRHGAVLEAHSIDDLVAAGVIDDASTATDLRDVFAALADPTRSNPLVDMLADPAVAPGMLAVLVEGLAQRSVNDVHAGFLGALVANTHRHLIAYSEKAVQDAAARVEVAMRKDVDDALAMAAEAERRAEAEERASLRAAEKEGKARQDCAAALRRAEEAEAKAAKLEAAIAPLRGLLAHQDA